MHLSQTVRNTNCSQRASPHFARPCLCRHEYHSMAQIISMACIWYQCVQWSCHLPPSAKTEATWRHLYPNLTLVLTWH